jgi:hypothetical protein
MISTKRVGEARSIGHRGGAEVLQVPELVRASASASSSEIGPSFFAKDGQSRRELTSPDFILVAQCAASCPREARRKPVRIRTVAFIRRATALLLRSRQTEAVRNPKRNSSTLNLLRIALGAPVIAAPSSTRHHSLWLTPVLTALPAAVRQF